jgi:hypothetical protein
MRYLSSGIMTNKKGVYSWGLRMMGMAVFFKWYREKTKKSLGLFLEMIWAIWALWSIMTLSDSKDKRYQGTIEIPKAWRLILIKEKVRETERKEVWYSNLRDGWPMGFSLSVVSSVRLCSWIKRYQLFIVIRAQVVSWWWHHQAKTSISNNWFHLVPSRLFFLSHDQLVDYYWQINWSFSFLLDVCSFVISRDIKR